MTGYRIKLSDLILDYTGFDTADALCAQTDPELFFPEKGDHATSSMAKRICNNCFLVKECLTEALQKEYPDGIWGGTSPTERRFLRQKAEPNTALLIPLVVEQSVARLKEKFDSLDKRREALRKSENQRKKRSRGAK